MADNTKDVQLRVGVKTSGAENIASLSSDLREMAKQGGDAAPAFGKLADELDHLEAATKEFRAAETAARTATQEQRRALDEKRDALARLRAETNSAARATDAYKEAERGARLAVIDARAALRQKQDALTSAAASAKTAAAAEQTLRAEATRVAAAYRQQGQEAAESAAKQNRANKSVADGLREIHGQLSTIRNLAAAAVGGSMLGGMVGDVAKTADAYQNLASRIRLVTGEGAAFDETFEGVFDVAKRTNSAVDETGTLFVRIAQAGKQIGLSTRDALALTETINQAIQVSGASAGASQAAITQLIQGLQSGVLRGEEFNSVMEQAPRLAQALADGLGVTTGELRKLAEAGKLTSQTVITALQGQASAVEREFANLPATVGRALQNLSTEWTRYVGEVDKAYGISEKAAAALNALAGNLDTVRALLWSLGKAAAAYQALKLAQTLLGMGDAAKKAAVAIAAVEAAQKGANAAAVAGTASAGRFAAVLGGIKTFGLLTVLTNFREIGTAIGEGAAKLMGYGKAQEELEIRMRADEQATREASQQKAAYAQQTALAAEAALGLTTESKKLVAEFEQVRQKGGSVADALAKVTKELELGDLTCITTAGAALDALAQKGQITAQQVREAWAEGLKGIDLGVFEVQARAAFDGSEQGARRLQAALDAIADESLRRVGLSTDELRSGFSKAATSAINDVDALAHTLEDLGATGSETSRALAASLSKATDAASTERALQAVIARFEELGRKGLIAGDQLAAGLDKARSKLDQLVPGVNSLDEAFRQLGMRGPAELQRIADASRAAWERIRNDGTVALTAKQEAFKRYADAAVAANDGIVSSEIKVQAELLNLTIGAEGVGRAFTKAGKDGAAAMDQLARAAIAAGAAAINAQREIASVTGRTREERLAGQNAVDNSTMFDLIDKLNAGTLTSDDRSAAEAVMAAMRQNQIINSDAASSNAGFMSLNGQRDFEARMAQMQRVLERTGGTSGRGGASIGGRRIEIVMGRKTTNVNVVSEADADALEETLRGLASAASRAG